MTLPERETQRKNAVQGPRSVESASLRLGLGGLAGQGA